MSLTTDRWLYLDDIRTPVSVKFDVVRNFEQFKAYILANGIPAFISFDHDLADEHYAPMEHWNDTYNNWAIGQKFKEKTGLDCARWLCDICLENKVQFYKCGVHSANVQGTRNIVSYLTGFIKHMGWGPESVAFEQKHPFTSKDPRIHE